MAAAKPNVRCPWCLKGNELYVAYHDCEWGVPAWDDQTQFEFLILEGAQAGLSWSTILNKREGYREAFAGFDPERIARFGKRELARLRAAPVDVRRRQADPESLDAAEADPGHLARIGCAQQGSQEARLQVRRQHHHLRAHAGDRDGERSHSWMFQVQGVQGAWEEEVTSLSHQPFHARCALALQSCMQFL
jgi:hypothetical protein